MVEQSHRRHGGLLWPVILIGAGVVFLLNNLGILDWSVWETLLRLWPVLLIGVGLDILIGRRSLLASALIALLLVGVLGAAIIWGVPSARSSAGYVDHTEQVSADLKDAQKAEVDISFGSGNLVLGALPAGSDKLIQGSVDLSEAERLQTNHRGSGANVRFELASENVWRVNWRTLDEVEDKVWDLDLTQDIPLALELNAGVGKSTLDLTSLNLTRLQVDGGVGQVTVRLPARGRYDVSIDGGVGEMILILPEALGARITVDGGLGSTDVSGDFERRDDEYTTPGFGVAEQRATIEISGGLGRVEIRRATE